MVRSSQFQFINCFISRTVRGAGGGLTGVVSLLNHVTTYNSMTHRIVDDLVELRVGGELSPHQ